jgi:hypothetical protein
LSISRLRGAARINGNLSPLARFSLHAVEIRLNVQRSKRMKIAGSILAAAIVALAVPAVAQTTPGSGAAKMSAAECTAAWTKLDAAKSGSVSQAQAQGTVTDFKTADANSDGKLTQAEFTAACNKGLVTAAGSTTGSRGMTGSDTQPPKK